MLLQCPQTASISDLLVLMAVTCRPDVGAHRDRRADGNDTISHESKIRKIMRRSDGDHRRDVRDVYGTSLNIAYLEYFSKVIIENQIWFGWGSIRPAL